MSPDDDPVASPVAAGEGRVTDVAERVRLGESPSGFPREDYEVEWSNRFGERGFNGAGARALGLARPVA